ncbi:MAG: hypothetical protein L0Y71_14405 [Gemmataceae bacterium]|nr:hypothetical protein [Gemmataceae bacterium]
MAEHLAAWDLRASVPVLTKMVQACREHLGDGSTYLLGRAIATLTDLRQQAGDEKALGDYAAWIRDVHPKNGDRDWRSLLRPMWRNPDHPAIVAAARAMFEGDKSPWTERFLRDGNTHDLFKTPLLGLASFRQRLLVELADQAPAGKIKLHEECYGFLEVTGAYSGGAAIHSSLDPLAPEGVAEVPFRVCDFDAFQLADHAGAPRCEVYWPVKERDRAVMACVAFLSKYGERFKFSPLTRSPDDWPREDRPRMAFPRRDRPATRAEFGRAEAVFSLDGAAKVRAWNLPAFPMPAAWVALKDRPYRTQCYDPKTKKTGTRTDYRQSGFVWQAEETWQDGRWRRYFGFVGSGQVAKVAAEEIEFPAPGYDWAKLSDGIDCRLSRRLVEKPPTNAADGPAEPLMGGPVIVQVELRNRSGVEQSLPTEVMREDPKAGPMLHPGIQLRLRYTASKDANRGASLEDDGTDWRDVAPKQRQSLNIGAATRGAAPAATFATFALDLEDWFDLSRPGGYRFQVVFDRRAGAFAEGDSQELQFSLSKGDPKSR